MTPTHIAEQLLTATPDASWLPAGSTAEVWVGSDCSEFEPAIIVRLLVWQGGQDEPRFFCVSDSNGLNLPTRFLGRGAQRESVRDGLARLTLETFGQSASTGRCIGFVRNVVAEPDAEYPHPTPHAHVPVFTTDLTDPVVDGQWMTFSDGQSTLASRHWWPIVGYAARDVLRKPVV